MVYGWKVRLRRKVDIFPDSQQLGVKVIQTYRDDVLHVFVLLSCLSSKHNSVVLLHPAVSGHTGHINTELGSHTLVN